MPKFIFAGLFFVILVTIIFFSPVFKIKTIKIDQDQNCLPASAVDLKGKNILTFQKDAFGENLKSKFSCIENVKISKNFPSEVILKIQTKETVVKIEGTPFSATSDGLLVGDRGEKGKPIFYPPQDVKFQKDQKVQDKLTLFSFGIAAGLSKSDFQAASIRIVDQSDIAVYSRENSVVIFSSEKPASAQIDSLQQILAQSKIDATKIAKIDLRFDKPIITFE